MEEIELNHLSMVDDLQILSEVLCRTRYGGFLKWGYPQSSSILEGFSLIDQPFWGTTICGNPQFGDDSSWIFFESRDRGSWPGKIDASISMTNPNECTLIPGRQLRTWELI